jgi:hypothetical protein
MADFISGLLGLGSDQDPMERAKQAGLLGFGATALQAGAPSLTPTSLGSILGQSVMAGQQASQQTLQQARQQAIQQEMMGTMGGMGGAGGQGGDTQAQIAKLQKMALLDPKNQAAYLKIAEQLQGKTAAFTGEIGNAALNLFGTADVSKLTPEQRQQANDFAIRQKLAVAGASAPRMTVNTSDPTAVSRELRQIVNDFNTQTADAQKVVKTYKTMENAVQNPSVAGDVSLVFNYFKTIDPQSTVREGEYDTIINATSVPDRIKNYAQRLKTGQKLTEGQRQDLLNTARQNVMAIAPQVQTTVDNYRGFVGTLGKDPDKVIRNPFEGIFPPTSGATPLAPPAAPPSGAPRTNPPRRWNPQTGAFE